jgi:hypothetical protein
MLKGPNEEILHWTKSMILSEEAYEEKLSIPLQKYISPASNAHALRQEDTTV